MRILIIDIYQLYTLIRIKKNENNDISYLNDYLKVLPNINNVNINEVIKKIENQELRQEIFEAINELPDKCKEVFKLSYLHDMKNKEIADTLGISLRTVEAHMYKALKFLRERLSHLLLSLIIFSAKLLSVFTS